MTLHGLRVQVHTHKRKEVSEETAEVSMFWEGVSIYSPSLQIMMVSFWIYNSMKNEIIGLTRKPTGHLIFYAPFLVDFIKPETVLFSESITHGFIPTKSIPGSINASTT